MQLQRPSLNCSLILYTQHQHHPLYTSDVLVQKLTNGDPFYDENHLSFRGDIVSWSDHSPAASAPSFSYNRYISVDFNIWGSLSSTAITSLTDMLRATRGATWFRPTLLISAAYQKVGENIRSEYHTWANCNNQSHWVIYFNTQAKGTHSYYTRKKNRSKLIIIANNYIMLGQVCDWSSTLFFLINSQ